MSTGSHRGMAGRRGWIGVVVASLLGTHAVLLGWAATKSSPTLDEPPHLAAGLYIWKYGRFDVYRVNPPLVKAVAALSVFLADPATNWRAVPGDLRPEWSLGDAFMAANGERAFWLLTLARWACIPLILIGGYACYRWATELYGSASGLLALVLWCFSPEVLAHGSLITPDAGAAALGVAGSYLFWRWLDRPNWMRAILAGLMLGLIELTKMTWLVLFGLWPALGLLWVVSSSPGRRGGWRRLAQLATIGLIGLYVLNMGYGFERSFRPLGQIAFVSERLGGPYPRAGSLGNRFAGHWSGGIPVPLPESYLTGLDVQQREFELPSWSYLRGEHRRGGWWYYYLYGLAVKIPLGIWALGALAVGVTLRWPGRYSAGWRHEAVLLAPAVVVMTLVSAETRYNHHLRYVLPAYPFALIWASKVARCIDFGDRKVAATVAVATAWAVGSSLSIYPHSLSYFNELVGGPMKGHYHLIDSNIDWGQDILALRDWLVRHPEARPLYYDCVGDQFLRQSGIEIQTSPTGPGPRWVALSVDRLRDHTGKYRKFEYIEPYSVIGFSIYVYKINCLGSGTQLVGPTEQGHFGARQQLRSARSLGWLRNVKVIMPAPLRWNDSVDAVRADRPVHPLSVDQQHLDPGAADLGQPAPGPNPS